MCAFAGLIVLSTQHGYIGTFCDDGTSTLPLDLELHLEQTTMVFIKYSIAGLANIRFALKYRLFHDNKQRQYPLLINPFSFSINPGIVFAQILWFYTVKLSTTTFKMTTTSDPVTMTGRTRDLKCGLLRIGFHKIIRILHSNH